ncbi:MAG: ATP-dependent helicase [Microbacteriaceae bacterium]|nr:ATP-dependent helicase [Microbacteriaceae bacterium]
MSTDPRSLDASQAAVVVLADDADAVVLGASGTGKTRTVVELVAERVLARGWDPAGVLVLAASRRTAGALRDRLAARLGVVTPGPMARTVASLAHGIVARAFTAEGSPPPVYVSGADHDRLIAALLAGEIESGADDYWPSTAGRATRGLPAFRGELRDLYARAAERGLRAADLAALGSEAGRAEWVAAARFMPRLAEAIEAEYAGFTPMDSSYVVRRATELVAAGDASAAELRLLVVDDAQELGRGAVGLLAALAARGTRLVAVGDPDLATGGFRGSQAGAFTGVALWGAVGRTPERLALGTVHRHGERIREVVDRTVSRIGVAGDAVGARRARPTGRAEAESSRDESGAAEAMGGAGTAGAAGTATRAAAAIGDGEVRAVVFASPEDQSAYIARRLRERHVHDGVPWSDLAVIVRSGASAPRLARELRALHVPTVAGAAAQVRGQDYAVRGLLLGLELALGRTEIDADSAQELLTSCIGRLDAVALRRLRTALRIEALKAERDAAARELLAEAVRLPAAFEVVDTAASRRARRVAESIHAARAEAAGRASVEELLWGLWSRSGLAEEWGRTARGAGIEADEANRHLDAVLTLFTAAKRYVERSPEASPGGFLAGWLGATVDEDSLAPRGVADAVLVGTPPVALGREFDTVVIADLQDGVWPNPRVRGSLLGSGDLAELVDGADPSTQNRRSEVLHDELRMFAASAGRARRQLVGSGVVSEGNAASPLLRLLLDGDEELRTPGDDEVAPLSLRGLAGRLRRRLVQTGDPGVASGIAALAAAGIPGAAPEEWYGLAGLSSTEPLFDPDAQVPVSPSAIEQYERCSLHWAIDQLGGDTTTLGASIGTIIHALAERITDESAEEVLPEVLAALDGLEFETDWVEELERERTRRIVGRLVSYQRDLARDGAETLARETRFRLEIGRALLSGTLDRIERYGERTAVIIDFKTGREYGHQTDGQVKDHPQLAAYQLALASGALDEHLGPIAGAAESGGAKLIILAESMARQDYRSPKQSPLEPGELEDWRHRIEDAAEGMSGATFVASVSEHCTAFGSNGPCRLHITRAVSAG